MVIVNPRLTCIMCYILHSDWSLLLLANIQCSLHCKQGTKLIGNIMVVYTVNKVAYRKHQGSLHCKQGSL